MAHFCAAATGPPGRLAWGIFAPPLTHGFDDVTADTLGGLDEVIVSQMRIAGGRGVAAVPEHLAGQGAVEEPNCGARRVQYQAAAVRKSVRSVWA